MSSDATRPHWHQHIHQQFRQRDLQQVTPFKAIMTACTNYSLFNNISSIEDLEAIHREEAMVDEMDSAREQQGNLEVQLRTATDELAQYKSGGGVDRRKFADLQSSFDLLKEEQTTLYRSQSSHVQRLLELNEQLKGRDASVASIRAELDSAHQEHASLLSTIDDLQGTLHERNFNLTLMQDELTALQLELLTTDDQIAQLKEENKVLVGRILERVAQTAETLNEEMLGKMSLASNVHALGSASSLCPSETALSFVRHGTIRSFNDFYV